MHSLRLKSALIISFRNDATKNHVNAFVRYAENKNIEKNSAHQMGWNTIK